MSFPIDAVYLDEDGQVLVCLEALKPKSVGVVDWRSQAVLEFPAGTIRQSRTEPGDQLFIDVDGRGAIHAEAREAVLRCLKFLRASRRDETLPAIRG